VRHNWVALVTFGGAFWVTAGDAKNIDLVPKDQVVKVADPEEEEEEEAAAFLSDLRHDLLFPALSPQDKHR